MTSNKWSGLRFGVPFKYFPHGWIGVGASLLGGFLIGEIVFASRLDHFYGILPYLYTMLIFCNALSGLMISKQAPTKGLMRFAFRVSAVFQMCLSYYNVRFLPSFRGVVAIAPTLVRALDVAVVVPLLGTGMGFWYLGCFQAWNTSVVLGIGILVGAVGLALTFVYPLQLAWQPDWLECVLEQRYKLQDLAMAAYIYIPATYTFALILFGATMCMRKLISAVQFGVWSIVMVTGTLLTTVLLQELQVPQISVQELYIACPAPATNQVHWLEEATSPRPILFALFQSDLVQSFFAALGAKRIEKYYSSNESFECAGPSN